MGSASVALVPVDMISEDFLTLSAAVSEEKGGGSGGSDSPLEVAIKFINHGHSHSVART